MKYDNEYLSDAELKELIADTENGKLLRTPSYLKPQIMKAARHTRNINQMNRIRMSAWQVMAACAAAVVLLALMPAADVQRKLEKVSVEQQMEKKDAIGNKMYSASNRFGNDLNSFAQKLLPFQKEDK